MEYNILVIGADHHNTLGVVESLAQKGIKPYVILYTVSPHSFIFHSKNVKDGWRCKDELAVLKCIEEHFCRKGNKTIVIATNDIVAGMLDRNHTRFGDFLIIPTVSPAGHLEEVMEKEYMSSLAKKVGLNVPKSWLMDNKQIPEGVEYPVITKSISSVQGGKGDIKVCYEEKDLREFISKQQHCSVIQIQQYIDKEFEFQLLGCSLNGGEYVIIPGRTHIVRPNGMDNTFFLSFDKCEPEFEETVKKATAFVKQTKYTGPFSIEFLRCKDGKNYFTEMNFRNDGNAYCVTHAGTNIPYILYLYHTGNDWQKELSQSYVNKVYLMPEIYYTTCLFRKEFGLMEWWNNMRKADCFTTFFKKDPIPFFLFIIWATWKRVFGTAF